MTQPTLVRSTGAADKARAIYDKHGVTASDIRAWAKLNGHEVADRGRLHPDLLATFYDAMAAGQSAA